MENDAKCAALAEATVGSLKDVNDGFVLIFGTMIGGGYIKDHKVHRGLHFSAGEVSYITTDRDGSPTLKVFGVIVAELLNFAKCTLKRKICRKMKLMV